jgi:FkbM family methyltransferase
MANRFQNLLVPQSLHLASNALKLRFLGGGEHEALQLHKLSSGFRTALDIGANRGDFTYQMSRLFETVWSFEPNKEASRPIKAAALKNVHLIGTALSSVEGKGILSLPVVNGQALDGWGSLEFNDRAELTKEFEVETRTLDSFDISNVDFVKLDVEGHEISVLNGAQRMLETWRPICLVELVDYNSDDLISFFTARGYSAKQTWNGVELSTHNRLFVPSS